MKLRLPLVLLSVIACCLIKQTEAAEYAWSSNEVTTHWQVILSMNWKNMDGSVIAGSDRMTDIWAVDGTNIMVIGVEGVQIGSSGGSLNINNLDSGMEGVGIGGLKVNVSTVNNMHSSDNKVLFLNGGVGGECLIDIGENFFLGSNASNGNLVSKIQVNDDVRFNIASGKKLSVTRLTGGSGSTIYAVGNGGNVADGTNTSSNVISIINSIAGLEANWSLSGGINLHVSNHSGNTNANTLGTGSITIDNGSIRFGGGTVVNDFIIAAGVFHHNAASVDDTLVFTGNFSGSGDIDLKGAITEAWILTGSQAAFTGNWLINRANGTDAVLQFGDGGATGSADYITVAGSGDIIGSASGAILAFDYSSFAGVGNHVTGSLAIYHSGSGVLSLTDGSNDYSGGTYVTGGGTLRLAGSGTPYGTGAINLADGGGLDANPSQASINIQAFALNASGNWSMTAHSGQTLTLELASGSYLRTGTATKKGSGELVLAGESLLASSGAIKVEEGRLTFGQGSNTTLPGSSISVDIASEGVLALNQSGTVNFASSLSGAGGLVLSGSAVYELSGDNNLTGRMSIGSDAELRLSQAAVLGSLQSLDLGGRLRITNNVDLPFQAMTNTGTVLVDAGRTLTISAFTGRQGESGTLNLVLGQASRLTFKDPEGRSQYLAGIAVDTSASLNFSNRDDIILNIANPVSLTGMGDYIILENYQYNGTYNYVYYNNGLPVWEILQDFKIRTSEGLQDAMINASGQIIPYDDDMSAGDLVMYNVPYQYTRERKYYGSLAGDGELTFTHSFSFAGGADPTYGFTLRNDTATGTPANSFGVDSLLVNGSSNQVRSVSIVGWAGAEDRYVAIGNTGNSFSGDLYVQSATLRTVGNVINTGFDQNDVTTLGIGNTIRLTTNSRLLLETGSRSDGSSSGIEGVSTYRNNIQLGQNNVYIVQKAGEHNLSGDINLIGTGEKVIENALADSTLILSGTITGGQGSSSLLLKTSSAVDAVINLALAGDRSSVSNLMVEGSVDLTSGTLHSQVGLNLIGNESRLTIGNEGFSRSLPGGVLSLSGNISGDAGSAIALAQGGVLRATGDLVIAPEINLDLEPLASGQTAGLDSGSSTIDIKGNIINWVDGAILSKMGSGTVIMEQDFQADGTLNIQSGTIRLEGNGNELGKLIADPGSVLEIAGSLSVREPIVMNGRLAGGGSLDVPEILFGPEGHYSGNMRNQDWDASFGSGASFDGYLQTAGNVVFESGSVFIGTTSLDTSARTGAPVHNPQLVVGGGGTVRLEGMRVTGDTTTDRGFWEQGVKYSFTLIQTESGNLYGADGNLLGETNLDSSAYLDPKQWGVFLTGSLSYVYGEQLLVILERNKEYVSHYALTDNQKAIAAGIDCALENYEADQLGGTELGDVIRYFNGMGDNIALQAPETLDILGGLTNYQALAGQRVDLLRHSEAVRLRAQAGGKGWNQYRDNPDNQFWIEATQSYFRQQAASSAPGYTLQTWGGALGVDFLSAAHFSLGAAFAYSNINVQADRYSAKSLGDAYYGDIYASWHSGPWSGNFVFTGGSTDFNIKRHVSLGDDAWNVKGSATGRQYLGRGEVAYAIPVKEGGPVLEPNIGMSVGKTILGSYHETGFGNAGLSVSRQKLDIIQAIVGVRFYEQQIDPLSFHEVRRWELRASLLQELGDKQFDTTSRFLGTDCEFRTQGVKVGQTALMIGGSFSQAWDMHWSYFADVNGEFRNNVAGMSSALGIRCTF